MSDPYTLVAAVGLAPAALTEVVYSLHRDRLDGTDRLGAGGRTPGVVHVLTTGQGRAQVQTELLTGGRSSRWSRLCAEVLGLDTPVPLHFHVATRDGAPLDDLRSRDDDLAFGEVAYALVRSLTDEASDPPLVGSIAGGRRTMGAHLTAAFTLCARTHDRLVHVLATPDPAPIAPAYWPGDGGEPLALDRVDVPFPHLREVLAPHFTERLGDGYNLRNLLKVLTLYAEPQPPASVRVRLARGARKRSPVDLLAADGTVLASTPFTPRMLSVLLLFADELEDARRQHGGAFGVVAQGAPPEGTDADAPLVAHAHTAARVNAVFDWCGAPRSAKQRKPWTETGDVSKLVSHYQDASTGLRVPSVHPMFARHLMFDTKPGHRLRERGAAGIAHDHVDYWHWATERALPVTVVPPAGLDARGLAWPFRHVARPARATDLDGPSR